MGPAVSVGSDASVGSDVSVGCGTSAVAAADGLGALMFSVPDLIMVARRWEPNLMAGDRCK